ncbi:MAG: DnaJ domain-containing protein [Leptospiraceae bacterium]|nr:DnaJ domain-containing protein [Leptospiraceae bacterium]MCP5498887.1 DnaJ domain-containing protein [Leptospiraceae bacterium]
MPRIPDKRIIPDLYALLELTRDCGPDEMKASFRRLAKLYHPDNPQTGSRDRFIQIHSAYKFLVEPRQREAYDVYLKSVQVDSIFILPYNRIIYTKNISELARRGLMRVGLRNKDREKYMGIQHDIDLILKEEECGKTVHVNLPLTVRVLCPSCLGSDLFCESCNGKGNYKGTRILRISFEPGQIIHNKLFVFDLGKFRPERFVHFKKKTLSLKTYILKRNPKA